MAVVYGFLASPPTRSVLLTAKLIGFNVNLKLVDLVKQENKSDSYIKLNPAHSVPTFVDEDGFKIFDSHAIVTYLVSKYAKDDSLYPKDLKKRALVDNMLHFNNSCLWTAIRGHFSMTRLFGKPYDADNEALFRDRMGALNTILGQRPYAAGERLTVADLCIINMVSAVRSFDKGEVDNFPHVANWQRKLQTEVECYEEIVAKGEQELIDYFPKRAAALAKAKQV